MRHRIAVNIMYNTWDVEVVAVAPMASRPDVKVMVDVFRAVATA